MFKGLERVVGVDQSFRWSLRLSRAKVYIHWTTTLQYKLILHARGETLNSQPKWRA